MTSLAPLALVSLALVLALVITSRRHARAFAPLSRRAPRASRHVLASLREDVSDALMPLASLAGLVLALVLMIVAR